MLTFSIGHVHVLHSTHSRLPRFPAAQRSTIYACSPLRRIDAVACDMDGTLLNSNSSVSRRNIDVVSRLLSETDVKFIPATGKSREGALRSMGKLGDVLTARNPSGVPGVYLQGLLVYGMSGEILFESNVPKEIGKKVVDLARKYRLSLIAYTRDGIICEKQDNFTSLLPVYKEPAAEPAGPWEGALQGNNMKKFIFMAPKNRIDDIRPLVATEIGDIAKLTQAQSNMLEVLPKECSKGDGVKRLLNALDVNPRNILAIGDAENDIEMLQMAGISCAVGNALPAVKSVAQYSDFPSNDDSGVAAIIEKFIFAEARKSRPDRSAGGLVDA